MGRSGENGSVGSAILIVIVVIVIIGWISGSYKSNEPVAKIEGSSNITSADKKEQTVFKPGDVIEFDGKKVTVQPAERNWDSENQFVDPSEGREFVRIVVTIENKSSQEVSYNTYDWEMQDSQGVIKDMSSAGYVDQESLSSGDLAVGGKVKGSLVFDVPKDDKGLTLRYEPSFWGDRKLEIKL